MTISKLCGIILLSGAEPEQRINDKGEKKMELENAITYFMETVNTYSIPTKNRIRAERMEDEIVVTVGSHYGVLIIRPYEFDTERLNVYAYCAIKMSIWID